MSKSPPGIKRVVSVLNFFVEHPGQAFTFTDIVKALKLGRATCHSLLAGLVEEQYLYRNVDKTYVIGPALVAVGRIAGEQFQPIQAAKSEMRALSDEHNVTCAYVYREGYEVVMHYHTGSGTTASWAVRQGHRLPLRAPFAAPFFVTSSQDEIDAWIENLPMKPSDKELALLTQDLAFNRCYGFSIGVTNPDIEQNKLEPERPFFVEHDNFPVTYTNSIEHDVEKEYSAVVSPVFGSNGKVEFVLAITGFSKSMRGDQIVAIAAELREAAERLTQFVTGSKSIYPFKGAPLP